MSDDRAAQLRRAFDATFAARPAAPEPEVELLAITVGGEPLAVRVGDLAAVHRLGRVQPLPGAPAELSGLVGIRGRVVPVYDLASLLGRSARNASRWLVLVGAPVAGLAFEALDRQERIAERNVVASASGERFVRHVATLESGVRAILDLPAVWEEIRRRAASSGDAR
jgi:purine-binding chemotaxis protein CheW